MMKSEIFGAAKKSPPKRRGSHDEWVEISTDHDDHEYESISAPKYPSLYPGDRRAAAHKFKDNSKHKGVPFPHYKKGVLGISQADLNAAGQAADRALSHLGDGAKRAAGFAGDIAQELYSGARKSYASMVHNKKGTKQSIPKQVSVATTKKTTSSLSDSQHSSSSSSSRRGTGGGVMF